jgi:Ca2+/Na+ antiporter
LLRAILVSAKLIGLTVVAVGTSLLELVACVIAALRRHPDVVLGIIGSNVYNVLGILGVATVVRDLDPPESRPSTSGYWAGSAAWAVPADRMDPQTMGGRRIPRAVKGMSGYLTI